MASAEKRDSAGRGGDDSAMSDLMDRLRLTTEESEFAAFSDDEDVGKDTGMEHAVIGKVLSPSVLHISTIMRAMRPAWGNPYGLTAHSVGKKEDNMFIAEFASAADKLHVLDGSPWVVGKHAVLLQDYEESLSAAEVSFAGEGLEFALWMDEQEKGTLGSRTDRGAC